MLSERLISFAVKTTSKNYLKINPTSDTHVPGPRPGQKYMLYMHVPFCERLCPYCSFNRFPFQQDKAARYFHNLRREMEMLAELGYDFESLYVGGGTPTIMIDELTRTIRQARDAFSIREVSSETNPNHLIPEYIDKLDGVVQRLSVGVQSFDDGLLKQMDRYDKYGSAETILERVRTAADARVFTSLNVDMIFNFPAQTEAMLRHDLEVIKQSHTNQTTFYPLMASPAVEKSLAATVGEVDYAREQRFYEIICDELVGAAATGAGSGSVSRDIRPLREKPAPFTFGSAWTFNASNSSMIDEYIVDYEEYPAIGSGGLTYLDEHLYVNTFSVNEYDEAIGAGRMSIMGATKFSKRDRMRYRMMMQLFGLRLDKVQWKRDFGCSFAQGLPAEYAYLKSAGAFDVEDDAQITLTPKGRYLMVAMMRQFFIGVNGVRDKARAALPADEDLPRVLEGASYLLEKKSGFVASPDYAPEWRRKRDSYAFKAGSCFLERFSGQLKDVSRRMLNTVRHIFRPHLIILS